MPGRKLRTLQAGKRLRKLRQKRGFTFRQVAEDSAAIAAQRRMPALALRISGLHEIEMEGRTPTVYHLYVLARIYRVRLRRILDWYGIPRS